jgi:hypothetical protein
MMSGPLQNLTLLAAAMPMRLLGAALAAAALWAAVQWAL